MITTIVYMRNSAYQSIYGYLPCGLIVTVVSIVYAILRLVYFYLVFGKGNNLLSSSKYGSKIAMMKDSNNTQYAFQMNTIFTNQSTVHHTVILADSTVIMPEQTILTILSSPMVPAQIWSRIHQMETGELRPDVPFVFLIPQTSKTSMKFASFNKTFFLEPIPPKKNH